MRVSEDLSHVGYDVTGLLTTLASLIKRMVQGNRSQSRNPWALLLSSQTVGDLLSSHLPSLQELLSLVTPGDSLKQEENSLIMPVT